MGKHNRSVDSTLSSKIVSFPQNQGRDLLLQVSSYSSLHSFSVFHNIHHFVCAIWVEVANAAISGESQN